LGIWYLPEGNENFWIDDVRVQPVNARMKAHVYDNESGRLLTTFDNDHFGMYYQYNAQGKLVRKRKETANGFKTIQEQQLHRPETQR